MKISDLQPGDLVKSTTTECKVYCEDRCPTNDTEIQWVRVIVFETGNLQDGGLQETIMNYEIGWNRECILIEQNLDYEKLKRRN